MRADASAHLLVIHQCLTIACFCNVKWPIVVDIIDIGFSPVFVKQKLSQTTDEISFLRA